MTRIRHDVNYMSDIDALVTEWYCWLNNALRSGDTISNRHPALGHRGRINLRPPSSQRSRAITAPTRFFSSLFCFFLPPPQKKSLQQVSVVGFCTCFSCCQGSKYKIQQALLCRETNFSLDRIVLFLFLSIPLFLVVPAFSVHFNLTQSSSCP